MTMQVAQFLCVKLAQKTDSAQQWRKQTLESGVLDASLQGLQSQDQAIAEPCAGIPCIYNYSHCTQMRLDPLLASLQLEDLSATLKQQIASVLQSRAHL